MVSDKTLTVLQLLSKPLREAVLERFGELTEHPSWRPSHAS
jgi:hypothetical protein